MTDAPPVPVGDALASAVHCEKINAFEAELAQLPQVNLPLNHVFTPGLYVREIFIPKGTLLTSKIHRTEHPFVISKGTISVWTEGEGIVRYQAPHTGVTKPGTRRVLYAHEDVIWSTFHPTHKTDVAEIEKDIIEPHHIPFPPPQTIAEITEEPVCTR